jgi:hypothetical protein
MEQHLTCATCNQPLPAPGPGEDLWLTCPHCGAGNANPQALDRRRPGQPLSPIGALGSFLLVSGAFGLAISVAIAWIVGLPGALFEKDSAGAWLILVMLLGSLALCSSGTLVLRGLKARSGKQRDGYYAAAFLVGLAALTALGFVFMTWNAK